ncbi:phage tail protein, partial [Acinetobacter baumannii]|nr:phage tail protein [Acinetobacter baumannii]MCG5394230.1 phage tail protein [Acinetobacter baumannii]MCG5405677.1 phage tail protein [Acinetobacter baumannii]MCG5409709.1 phage tail protein [Acinetobacter baumannii]MCG5417754.1 phage tail protein [Acinetobacter baumannii]
MTVQVTDRLSQLYVGNGVNTRFDFTFRVFDQEDATGVAVHLFDGVDFEKMDELLYQVFINADKLGGYVVFNNAPDSETSFYIGGETPVDQQLDITNYDNFYPDSLERSLDKLTGILQEWSHLLGFEKQARILSGIKYDEDAKNREELLKNELQNNIDFLQENTNAMLEEAIANGAVSALAVTVVECLDDLITVKKWQGRTVNVRSVIRNKHLGGGTFVFNKNSTRTPDGYIVVADVGGNWEKITVAFPTVDDFGGLGDDPNYDDADAFIRCALSPYTGSNIYLANRQVEYRIN